MSAILKAVSPYMPRKKNRFTTTAGFACFNKLTVTCSCIFDNSS